MTFPRIFGPMNSPVQLSYIDDNFNALQSTSTYGLTKLGINTTVNASTMFNMVLDAGSDTAVVRMMHIQRTASLSIGASGGVYSALRVYSNVTAKTPAQSEWAINAVVDSASNASATPTAVSGTATKTGDAGVIAGHFNALDTRTYNNETSVTSLTSVEVDVNGTGRDHPTSNNGTGSRRGMRIQPRVAATATPSWPAWQSAHTYSQYDAIVPTTATLTLGYTGLWQECTTGGVSGGAEPAFNTTVGATTTDNSVVWTTRKGYEAGIGLHVTTNPSNAGYFRYGIAVEEDTGDQNVIGVGIRIKTGGTTGIEIVKAHTGSDILCNVNSGYGITLSGNYTNAALRVADDQYIAFNSSANRKVRVNSATDSFEFLAASTAKVKFNMTGTNCVFLANAAGTPATPTGGGNLYVEGGILKYVGSSGTVTTIAVA